mmetsp:Transcript_1018/g.2091  ORF Transcript_1018/g.2091 Transcript_1018/m.2091 type:complete len:90 (+) Transcript_1018:117-386(+)
MGGPTFLTEDVREVCRASKVPCIGNIFIGGARGEVWRKPSNGRRWNVRPWVAPTTSSGGSEPSEEILRNQEGLLLAPPVTRGTAAAVCS